MTVNSTVISVTSDFKRRAIYSSFVLIVIIIIIIIMFIKQKGLKARL